MITSHTVLSDRADDIRANWLASQLQSLESNDFLVDSFGGQYPGKAYGKRVYWHDQRVNLTHLTLSTGARARVGLRYHYQGVKIDTKLNLVSDMQAFLVNRLLGWNTHFGTVTWVTIHSPNGVRHAFVGTQFALSASDFEVYDAY